MTKKSIASSPREKLVRVSASAMRKPLTKKQRQDIEALAAKPDSDIDFSDIPETVGTPATHLKVKQDSRVRHGSESLVTEPTDRNI